MQLVVYSQYYRTSTAERQQEIDECLRRNLNHPGISRVVLFCEPDAPPLPRGTVPVEVVPSETRLTYAEWFHWLRRQGSGIGLLLNADIYLDQGLQHLASTFCRPDVFLALTRYNPGHAGFHLNDYPHWTQDVWGVRADAELPESLLYASSFPLGFPGCDNRIAYVMWSHGFRVRNPCYHVRSVHLQASTARAYDKSSDRLYGGVTYVHPSLAPDEDAELEFTLWTRSEQRPPGVLINQQAIDQGVHQLHHGDNAVAQRFLDQQQFTGMSWEYAALGSAHLQGALYPCSSEDTVFLPMSELLETGVELTLPSMPCLQGLCLRLPRRAAAEYQLELEARGPGETRWLFRGPRALRLKADGERLFWQDSELQGLPLTRLQLRLSGPEADPVWRPEEGAELVLFAEKTSFAAPKSLHLIAEDVLPQASAPEMIRPDSLPEVVAAAVGACEVPPYRWCRRSDCQVQLDGAELLHVFGTRFRVLRCGDALLFDDRFWPSLGVSPIGAVPCSLDDASGLLLWGFGQPALELRQDFFARTKRFSGDVNFWQYPCRTEEDAFAVHRGLPGPQLREGVLQLYLGLPWATWIDLRAWPVATIQAVAERLRRLRCELKALGIGLKVHSVCQHILWREHLHMLKAAGVECIWLSHKSPNEDHLEGVELRAWPLYAVNAREPDRSHGLSSRPPSRKAWLASFVGAHMEHYITDVRLRLLQFKDLHRFLIKLNDEWHFNSIVYGEQAEDAAFFQRSIPSLAEDCPRYNRVLTDSVFTLCPAGAGPNSLRLWEALSVGSVPVILSDHLVLPNLAELTQGRWTEWEDIVIFHSESDLESLPDRLSQVSMDEIERRSAAGIALMADVHRFTCLGVVSSRVIGSLPHEEHPDEEIPVIVVPVYGPEDRYYWRQKKHGFYDVVLEWYLRGLVRIRFGEKGYFWWGGESEILLMERDLVINLHDGKVDPPRWVGEVPYKYGFFFNQYHLKNSRNHKATYFTYAPVHMEEMRERLGRKSWIERTHASIFAGSIENETQEFFRNRFKTWEDAIEIFSCVDRLHHHESHRYTLDEYLDLIAHSRFGVCFRGNGPKCFREMEYLAFGTPLIITPGVEVDYPSPLIEGVHFFRANAADDIRRIVQETDEETWEQMSQACWQWFECHGTLSQMFSELRDQINRLDFQSKQHQLLRVLAPRSEAEHCLAVRSLELVDPNADWIASDEPGDATLELQPDVLLINELPFQGQESAYQWYVLPADQQQYCEGILESDLEIHKRLLELMGIRLRNFRIQIYGHHGHIPLWERRIDTRRLQINHNESAVLRSDYDWSRQCSKPYLDRQLKIDGPAIVARPDINASLVYVKNAIQYYADLSGIFADYHAMYDDIIPESEVYRCCKLWRFQDSCLSAIHIKITSENGCQEVEYRHLLPSA